MTELAEQAVTEIATAAMPVDRDRIMREAFNQVVTAEAKESGKEPDLVQVPVRNADGKFAKATVAESSSVPVEAKETKAQDKSESVKTSVTDDALEQALKALRLDKYETADFDGMSRERIVALGSSAAKRQADISKRFEELSLKTKAVEEAAAAKTTERNGQDEPPQRQPSDLAAVKLMAQKLGLSEDDEPALVAWQESVTAPIATELKQAQNLLGQMAEVVFTMRAEAVRGQLPESLKKLVDDKTFSENVLPRAQRLLRSGEYTSLQEALHDSAVIATRSAIQVEVESDRARTSAARENGSMSPVDRRSAPKPKSLDDRLKAAFELTEKGATEAEVRAAFSG